MPDIDQVLDNLEEAPKSKEASKAKGKADNKRLSVERIYQKKTQLEHILLRPDTYIGSIEKDTQVRLRLCKISPWLFGEPFGNLKNCFNIEHTCCVGVTISKLFDSGLSFYTSAVRSQIQLLYFVL